LGAAGRRPLLAGLARAVTPSVLGPPRRGGAGKRWPPVP